MIPSPDALSEEGLASLEEQARRLWNERQEDCAWYGADIPMPSLPVKVDTLANILAALRARQEGETPPWRIMTPEEYSALNLKGRHVVERDYDVGGAVAVWMIGDIPAPRLQPVPEGVRERLSAYAASLETAVIGRSGYKGDLEERARDLRALLSAHPGTGEAFQARVQPWMMACFGPEIAADKLERNDRFIEEALELVQASGYTPERAHELVDYVFGRPVGEINQEVGGVMVTLASFCLAHGVDMHEGGETELARIWTKVDQIRAKQLTKPKGSALPVPRPTSPEGMPGVEEIADALRLILPMAKGYASANRVGSNQAYIEAAELALSRLTKTGEAT